MRLARWSLSLVAIVGIAATTVAGATIWLLLTDPVKVNAITDAVGRGDVGPIISALGAVIYDALRGLFKYL